MTREHAITEFMIRIQKEENQTKWEIKLSPEKLNKKQKISYTYKIIF
jgi:hypothetical protein